SSFDAKTIERVPHFRLSRARDSRQRPCDDRGLRLLDDAIDRALLDNGNVEHDESACTGRAAPPPPELASSDPEVLRAALAREHGARRRADCLATMQTEVVQLALDLLVREPDIEGFFGALTKTMVEDTESHACAVWLLDDDRARCDLWMAYGGERLYLRRRGGL